MIKVEIFQINLQLKDRAVVGGFSCQLVGSLGSSWCNFTAIPNTVKSLDELHGLISTQIQMFIVQSQIKD